MQSIFKVLKNFENYRCNFKRKRFLRQYPLLPLHRVVNTKLSLTYTVNKSAIFTAKH